MGQTVLVVMDALIKVLTIVQLLLALRAMKKAPRRKRRATRPRKGKGH